ncbi:hypothetical protein ACFX43_03220 [Nocardioides sp. YIM B13467]
MTLTLDGSRRPAGPRTHIGRILASTPTGRPRPVHDPRPTVGTHRGKGY